MSDSLWLHGLQHARPLCPSPSLEVCPMSMFMAISSEMPSSHLILWCSFLLLSSIFPSIRDFSNESAVHIRWTKYWSFSFSISPSKNYSGFISLNIWYPCYPKDFQESSSAPQFEDISSSVLHLHGSLPCCGERACVTRWSYKPCHVNPRQIGHAGDFWQNWRNEWQTTPVYLPWEPHELYKRASNWVSVFSTHKIVEIFSISLCLKFQVLDGTTEQKYTRSLTHSW